MGCTACRSKECRTSGRDCFGVHDASLEVYAREDVRPGVLAASGLVDGGRAGTLDRLEEVIEYAQRLGYVRVGVAYCFGLAELAKELEQRLRAAGLSPVMVQCSAGGVREREIDPGKQVETVSCNPVGQALTLQQQGAQFVLEMGLCMGHDVLLHQHLQVPFTTFLVKDRVYEHAPAKALGSSGDALARLLEGMDDKFRMVTDVQLAEWLAEAGPPVVLDVRAESAFAASRVPGSVNVPLRTLPARYRDSLPERRRRVVCVCQGSVQSAYALAFLSSRGYREVFNLSGGFGRWSGQGRPVEAG